MIVRTAILGIALAASPATAHAQDPAGAPLVPSGEWVTDAADSMCTLTRRYGADAQALEFGLATSPGNRVFEIRLALPPGGSRTERFGVATIELLPSGETVKPEFYEYSIPDARLARFYIKSEEMVDLGPVQSIRLGWGGRRSPVHILLADMPAALRMLDTCMDSLARAWGQDPELLRRIATPARPSNDPATWVTDKDYPRSALVKGASGITRIHWTVDTQGRAIDCVVHQGSGSTAMDKTVCRLIAERARYAPAVDKDGKTVASLQSGAVRWTIVR